MALKSETPARPEVEPDDDEDDYMSMAIAEPSKPYEKETYTQRRMRKQREAESKNPKSRAVIEAEAAAAREKALSTALPSSSKGFKMLSKFGFEPGDALGAKKSNPAARTEPIELDMKIDRGGIGMDSEKKRKFRDAVESEAKRVKSEEGDFRERVSREREAERLERQVGAAMRVAERMDEEDRQGKHVPESVAAGLAPAVEEKEGLIPELRTKAAVSTSIPTSQVNILWRGLVRARVEKERDRRMRHDLMQSLSSNPNYNDRAPESNAFGTEEEELDEEDVELEEFNALEPGERLQKLVEYLRSRWHYCFWCKHRYDDDTMDGCPGLTEEDHD